MLAGCGQRGPLYLPRVPAPPPAGQPARPVPPTTPANDQNTGSPAPAQQPIPGSSRER